MKFFKAKAARWAATFIIGAGLTYVGMPPAMVASFSSWGGDQVEQAVKESVGEA